MKTKKFTFKTEKSTGAYRSFYDDIHYIKYEGKIVGSIDAKTHQIRLMVYKNDIMEDKNPNCEWKNIFMKNEFDSIPQAKDFLNKHIEQILATYKLHQQED